MDRDRAADSTDDMVADHLGIARRADDEPTISWANRLAARLEIEGLRVGTDDDLVVVEARTRDHANAVAAKVHAELRRAQLDDVLAVALASAFPIRRTAGWPS